VEGFEKGSVVDECVGIRGEAGYHPFHDRFVVDGLKIHPMFGRTPSHWEIEDGVDLGIGLDLVEEGRHREGRTCRDGNQEIFEKYCKADQEVPSSEAHPAEGNTDERGCRERDEEVEAVGGTKCTEGENSIKECIGELNMKVDLAVDAGE